MQQYPANHPRHHTASIKQMLDELIKHSREDVRKVEDPQAKALFETTAEVLTGLRNAYDPTSSAPIRLLQRAGA